MYNFKSAVKTVGTAVVTCAAVVMSTGSAFALDTLVVPDVAATDLYSIAGKALAFVAIVIAISAGISMLKRAK